MSRQSRRNQAQGLLGETLGRPDRPPRGPSPTAEELALLVEGRLGRRRRRQVLSHLAADESLYRQWLDLAEMADGDVQKGQSRLLRRLRDFFEVPSMAPPVLIGAAAATLVVALGFLLAPQWTGPEPPPAGIVEAERQQGFKAPEHAARDRVPADAVSARHCVSLDHPLNAGLSTGKLCVLMMENDAGQRLARWQWRYTGDNAAETVASGPAQYDIEKLIVSDDGLWLATRERHNDQTRVVVRNSRTLMRGNVNEYETLPVPGEGMEMAWEEGRLVIRPGDAEDSPALIHDPRSGKTTAPGSQP